VDLGYISDATLHITVRGPQGINLTIVDIPGLVSGIFAVYLLTNVFPFLLIFLKLDMKHTELHGLS
jgi:hypothetical protein